MSALTGLTVDQLAFRPDLRAAARSMMEEAATVAQALGIRLAMNIDERMDLTGSVGAHKTSMLQDLERGRPMEIDALLGAVAELGRLTGKPTPLCAAVLAMLRGARASGRSLSGLNRLGHAAIGSPQGRSPSGAEMPVRGQATQSATGHGAARLPAYVS